MKRLEVGKLYSCSEHFLMLYPDRETADAAVAAFSSSAGSVSAPAAAYWTREFARKLGKPVSYCNPQTPLLVLSTVNKYVEVLMGDRKGWIINEDWLELKEISCT
jgi:hypothetical protein